MPDSLYYTITTLILAVAALQVGTGAPTGQTTHATGTPNPSSQVITLHYYNINAEMYELRRNQKTAYDEYKMDRFGDPDIDVPYMSLAGIPDLSGLTNADRFAMNESDLLQLHRSSLQAYGQLMLFVSLDEGMSNSSNDFGPQFNTISARIARVVANIEDLMRNLGFFQNGFPTPPSVTMAPEDNELIRNIRDLYVLQTMFSYLPVAEYDLYIRFLRHAHDAASQ